MAAFAAGGIEREIHTASTGQLSKFAQQLITSHPEHISATLAHVKSAPSQTVVGASAMSDIILQARDLERHYAIRRGLFKGWASLQALRGASFELHAGRTLAVVGESGCGKSTLARLVTLIEPPSAGELRSPASRSPPPPPSSGASSATPSRSSSRTPTARSTRARRSAPSSRSRSR